MRTRRSLLNFGTALLFFAITTATALVTTPWLVGWLGAPSYGAFRVIFAWYGYLTLLELGLGGAIGPMVARNLAQENHQPLERTLSAGVRAYALVSLGTIAVGLAATPWIPGTVRDLAPSLRNDLQLGWMVMLIGFLPLVFLPFRALQDAAQLGYRVNLIQILQSLVITAISLILASRGWGILGQSIALTVGAWICPVLLTLDALRTRPGLLGAVLRSQPDPETRRSLRSLSGSTLVFNVTSRISLMTDDIVVGKILGDLSVTRLFVSQRLAVLAQSQIQAVGSATWAALAQLHAQGESEAFRRRLIELTRLVSVLGVSALAPIVAYNPAFIQLWMRDRFEPFAAMDAVILISALNAWLMGLVSLWGWCLSGTGQMGLLRSPAVYSAIINLSLSVVLCRWLGLPGVLLGTTIALLTVNIWYLPILLFRTFGIRCDALVRAAVLPLGIGLPVGLVCWWVARSQTSIGWLLLILQMSVGLGISLGLCGLLLFGAEDRHRWRARISGLRSRTSTASATS